MQGFNKCAGLMFLIFSANQLLGTILQIMIHRKGVSTRLEVIHVLGLNTISSNVVLAAGKHALGDRARKLDKGILIVRFELPFNIWW